MMRGGRLKRRRRECSGKSLLDDFDVSVREHRAHGLWRDENELSSPGLSCCGDLCIQAGGSSANDALMSGMGEIV